MSAERQCLCGLTTYERCKGMPVDGALAPCEPPRVVPEAALRAWIEDKAPYRVGSWRYSAALDDLSVFLDSLHAEDHRA